MKLEELLKNVAEKLKKADIPYMVIGGQAAIIYREARFTNDVDILLGIDIDKYSSITNIAQELGLTCLTNNVEEFLSQTMVLPYAEPEYGFKVDFIFSYTDYEREAILRSFKVNLDNTEIAYSCIEDLIILKIFAGRQRDLDDVRNILIKNPKIDRTMIIEKLSQFSEALDMDFVRLLKEIESNI